MQGETRTVRGLLWCGIAGPVLFVAVFLVEGATRADYSPLRHPVSSLQLGELGWMQTANFVVTGTLLVAFAVGARTAWRRYGGGVWVPLLVALVGIGLVGAGVFRTDPVSGYPPGTPLIPEGTLPGALHDAFSTPVFLGLPVACCVAAYRFGKRGRRGWVAYSLVTAPAFLVGFFAASLGFVQHPLFAPYGGLLQRVTIVLGFGWLAALAAHLLRNTPAGR